MESRSFIVCRLLLLSTLIDAKQIAHHEMQCFLVTPEDLPPRNTFEVLP